MSHDAMRFAVWIGFADLEGVGYEEDVSFLDDFSHEDAVKLEEDRAAIRKFYEDHYKSQKANAFAEEQVPEIKELAQQAVTTDDLQILEDYIDAFDKRHPFLKRSLRQRVARPMARHWRRVKNGYVCIPSGTTFPVKMKKGKNQALASDSWSYKHWVKQGYIPA